METVSVRGPHERGEAHYLISLKDQARMTWRLARYETIRKQAHMTASDRVFVRRLIAELARKCQGQPQLTYGDKLFNERNR
jgi:hypothetical protein